jgi:hypothetical protein
MELDADPNKRGPLTENISKFPDANPDGFGPERIGVAYLAEDPHKGETTANGKGDRVWVAFVYETVYKIVVKG